MQISPLCVLLPRFAILEQKTKEKKKTLIQHGIEIEMTKPIQTPTLG